MTAADFGRAGLPATEPTGYGLHLRHWRGDSDEEAGHVLRGLTDPEYRRWNTPNRQVDDIAGAVGWIRGRLDGWQAGVSASFCVTDGVGGAVLGCVGVNLIEWLPRRGRIGYWVLPEARGRGVATYALALCATWGFVDVGLHRLELDHAVGHDASCRVATRVGFAYEGTQRDRMFEAGRYDAFRDAHIHARLSTDPEPSLEPRLG